nr:immunoglobulin light chain junction region [Macaca mulatta]MOV94550.1 immunoglobulin light chain junction region [Macaca mulatta]MOV94975.1 immunoglobulin light chain junction region [Macaca mulatta]MOV95154.1 immunoglobulin light chain junction region [Macaca mulatta]MOV95998.1 immunoglobulin light chain junction region [Macaca mulatta]
YYYCAAWDDGLRAVLF